MSTASVLLTRPDVPQAVTPHLRRVKPPPRPPAVRPPPTARSNLPAESAELLHDLNIEVESLARNVVPASECTRTARFVDVASGKVILEQLDFALGSVAPLRFDRVWLSCSTYRGPLGRGWHHAYDVALARASDTAAVRTADGRVVWMPPPGTSSSYEPDERMSLSRDQYGYVLRDAAGTEHRFVPHRAQAAFVLGSRRSRDGQELRFGYDHRARLVRITDRRGADLELDYDAEDRIVEIRAADPQRPGKHIVLVRYAYDPGGNLRKASDALGQARRYGYERGLLVKYDDRNGCATQFEWDGLAANARCVHSWVDAGLHDRALDYLERRTRVRDSFGHVTSYAHDGAHVHRIADAGGNVRELQRGPSRRLEREVDELGHERRYVYDARGNLLELHAPDGSSCSFEYDDRDRLLRALDAVNGVWELEYDERGRLTRSIDPLGGVTRFHHRGRWLVGVTDAADHHTGFAYDDRGNLAARTNPDGGSTRYHYDAWGQVTGVTDPHGNHEQREYDLLGRLVRVQEPDGNRIELAYDAEGNLVRRKDGQHDVRFTYQGTGTLSSRSEDGYTLCFEYDREERLVGIVNEDGKLFRLRRGPTGHVIETCGFDGCVRAYVRDAAGRVVRIERGEVFSEYEYDAVGRVIEVQHSDGAFEGYRHRADGALISAWNQSGTLGFERDLLGRLVREQQGEHVVEYAYDAAGQPVELRSSLGTRQTFDRDGAGRMRRIAELGSELDVRVARDALGLEIERTLAVGGRGVRSAWQRDTLGRPSGFRLEDPAGELLHKLVYEWEIGGRLRRCTDGQRGSTEYHYDARGKLAWMRTGAGSYQLRMPDAIDDVYGRDDRLDRAYGPAGQLLLCSTREGEIEYAYDAQGNRTSRCEPAGRSWRYAWTASGLLKRVTDPNGDEISFGYDALGRRIRKRARGLTTHFVWAGGALLHEWVDEGAPQPAAAVPSAGEESPTLVLAGRSDARGSREAPVTWVHDPDTGWPVAKLAPGGRFTIITDHAGTPRSMLDHTGRPVWVAEETIFGALRTIEGEASVCRLRGPGLYDDLETGLYCGGVPARYYDAGAGVHVCQGPLAAPPLLRAYARRADRAPRAARELRPAHAWLERVALPCVTAYLPSPEVARGILERSRDRPQLTAADPVELMERVLGGAFEGECR